MPYPIPCSTSGSKLDRDANTSKLYELGGQEAELAIMGGCPHLFLANNFSKLQEFLVNNLSDLQQVRVAMCSASYFYTWPYILTHPTPTPTPTPTSVCEPEARGCLLSASGRYHRRESPGEQSAECRLQCSWARCGRSVRCALRVHHIIPTCTNNPPTHTLLPSLSAK